MSKMTSVKSDIGNGVEWYIVCALDMCQWGGMLRAWYGNLALTSLVLDSFDIYNVKNHE
jgi:hypothetical protein